eukprot:382775-Pyramimonas_sp.AAC.1
MVLCAHLLFPSGAAAVRGPPGPSLGPGGNPRQAQAGVERRLPARPQRGPPRLASVSALLNANVEVLS